jgi:hypothetical protein
MPRLLAVATAVLGAAVLLTPQVSAAPARPTALHQALATRRAADRIVRPLSRATPGRAANPIYGAVALSPDHSGVWQWLGSGTDPMAWQQIGGPAGNLYASNGVILATNPGNGDLYAYEGSPNHWHKIGGPGRTFALQPADAFSVWIYGLSPDGSGVYIYTPSQGVTAWERIGGAANWIYAGGAGLFATNPQTGNIYSWNGSPDDWSYIGEPGRHFVVNNVGLYGLTPSGDAIYQWVGGARWTQVGTAAAWMYAASHTLLATNPQTGDVYRYAGHDTTWDKLGGPGSDFAIDTQSDGVYGLSPNKDAVYRFAQYPTTWDQIGGPASVLAAT